MIFRGLCVVCAALLVSDLFYHKHVHYTWEGWVGFYGLYGLLSCGLLGLAAKGLRRVLRREEDYYDR